LSHVQAALWVTGTSAAVHHLLQPWTLSWITG